MSLSSLLLLLFVPPLCLLMKGWGIWGWYAFLCVCCGAGNAVLLTLAWRRVKPRSDYEWKMKCLAVPWVFECMWRSVFPSLYLQRFVFWDTPLNSIMVDRTFACVGELAWVYQVSLALRHVDEDVAHSQGRSSRWWIRDSAWLAFLIYVAAEFTSYYNVATTNEWWAGFEVFLDGLSFLVMAPGSFYLLHACPGSVLGSSAKVFCAVMCVVCLVYPAFNFFVDVPMYLERYHTDERQHKHYFHFFDGLVDAAVRRVPTHQVEDWKQDMFWMGAYFLLGAWSGIALMWAPRLPGAAREGLEDLSQLSAQELADEVARLETRLHFFRAEAQSRVATLAPVALG